MFGHGARALTALSCALLLRLPFLPAFAQSADDGYNPTAVGVGGPGTGAVYALAAQPDGKMIVGGDFNYVAGENRVNLARLLADGTIDPDFATPPDLDLVFGLALQPDGKVLVGGAFGVMRLDANGAIDPTFTVTTDDAVYVIALVPGGMLLGGNFTQIDGVTRRALARVDGSGNLDATLGDIGFKFANSSGAGAVNALALQDDGKIVVGGYFDTASGLTRNYVARIGTDNLLDPYFDPNTDRSVAALSLQPDGKIVLGGHFHTVGGAIRNNIARITATGAVDPSFDPDANGNPLIRQLSVFALQRLPDGKLLLGGTFSTVGGATHHNLARLNADDSVDSTFVPDLDSDVTALALQPDGKVVAGGLFLQNGTTDRWHLARFYADGGLDGPCILDVAGSVSVTATQPDGKTLIAGEENLAAAGQPVRFVERINSDCSLDAGFDAAIDGPVYAMSVSAEGIVLGGNFDHYAATSRVSLARVKADGSLDVAFDPGLANGIVAHAFVNSIARQADGKLIIGGDFSQVGGYDRQRIARLNANGSVDTAFQAYVSGDDPRYVSVLALQSDGSVILAGEFDHVNDVSRNGIARVDADGNLDASFNPGTDRSVYALAVQPDDRILVAGNFGTIGGAAGSTWRASNRMAASMRRSTRMPAWRTAHRTTSAR